ncbi:MAG TPA: endolytic transglycosylase MltG, partial [Thermodesulfobacteriota bacterium]|nr:endolytic transglycosylase MltG [Thermodesulfobacteriota bacterium]
MTGLKPPPVPRRRFTFGAVLLIASGGLLITLVAAAYLHFVAPASWTKENKIVSIPSGKSFHEIARVLEENGVIRDHRSFYLLARLEGDLARVKAGEYELNTS